MYIKPLTTITDSHSMSHHSVANDLQMHIYDATNKILQLLHSVQSCISDIEAWATVNMLKLNNDKKTELILFT